MKSILRTLVLAPVALAVVAFTAQSAMAAATVKVPFTFTVNGKECPAGLYSVDRNPSTHIVSVHGIGTSKSFNWVLNPAEKSADENLVILKFAASGDTHALQYVQFGAESTHELDKQTKRSHTGAALTGQGR